MSKRSLVYASRRLWRTNGFSPKARKHPYTMNAFCASATWMEKNFIDWHTRKEWLHDHHNAPTFQKRDVWWCSIGVNIGHEEDGKGKDYSRPVLVVRKFNEHIFWGVPLTTQIKSNPYYHRIHFKGREQCVMLSQLRLWESKRLTDRMGQLPEDQFQRILKSLQNMLV